MAGPPDDPTRRLEPAPPPTTPRELAYAEGDPVTSRAALLDELRSLKRWLAVVSVLAVAGLGVALYTLLSDREDGDGRGASRSSVSQLRDRVDELESDVRDRASDDSVSELRQSQKRLEGRVEELGEQASDGSGDDAARAAVEDATQELRSEIGALDQRVKAAEQAAEQAAEAGGTGDTGAP